MNPRKKEIESVESGGCAESYPCQHSITIKYKDGTIEEEPLFKKDRTRI